MLSCSWVGATDVMYVATVIFTILLNMHCNSRRNILHMHNSTQISNAPINPDSDDSNKKEFAKIGAIVDIKWTVSEVHGTD